MAATSSGSLIALNVAADTTATIVPGKIKVRQIAVYSVGTNGSITITIGGVVYYSAADFPANSELHWSIGDPQTLDPVVGTGTLFAAGGRVVVTLA
jgi:hypothetical protein